MRSLKAFVPRPMRNAAKTFHRAISHNAIYDKAYYANDVEGPSRAAAPTMARSLYNWARPKTVIDVGCGTGALLAAFRNLGCDVHGLEYSSAALEYCRARRLSVQKYNIERGIPPSRGRADLAVSFEVAEHLPERVADFYVKLLCSIAPVVVISAAVPGQGGTDHVNEQPCSYWIQKFERFGFFFNQDTSRQFHEEWRVPNVAAYYRDNVMVFSAR